jgi:hypothetical protein
MILHRIPLVIFDIIHCFLSHHDYRQLLSTNHAIFGEVKYETVYYDLKQFLRVQDEKTLSLFQIDPVMQAIKTIVKSPQKQISMKWFCESLKDFLSFHGFYAGIHHLILIFYRAVSILLPLHLLSEIFNLKLVGIANSSLKGISGEIKTDGKPSSCDIRVLTLENCYCLEDISEIHNISTLKKIHVSECRKIQDFSFVSNIEEAVNLEVVTDFCQLSFRSGEKQKSLHVTTCLSVECETSTLLSLRH